MRRDEGAMKPDMKGEQRVHAVRRIAAALLFALALPLPAPVYAQVYPARPIKLVVPFAAGGAADIVGRAVAERLAGVLKQQIVVENIAGAGGALATSLTAKAEPDGYTLLYVTTSTFVTTPIFIRTANYDPLTSFAPISLLSSMAAMVVVNPSLPAQNLGELAALIKAAPGRYRYATSGVGTLSFLGGELFKSLTRLDIREVQAKGPTAAAQSVVSGDADMMFDLPVFFVKHAREGKLRPLAAMGISRSPDFRDVPTAVEAGLPELLAYAWSGVVAPAGTPRDIVDVINRAVRSVLAEIETQATFQRYGLFAEGSTPGEFERIIRAELTKWSRALPLSATAPR